MTMPAPACWRKTRSPKDIEAAFLEIERRIEACDAGYPFDLSQSGRSLHSIQNSGSSQPMIYKYLLLATRLNMSKNRTHAGIDGALLFEEVSAEAARSYLGPSSESMIFGTAAEATNFEGKVNDLCHRIGEGMGTRTAQIRKDTKEMASWMSCCGSISQTGCRENS